MSINRGEMLQAALGEIHRSAIEMSAEEFFHQLDTLVENSRKFIDSFDDEETKGRLREVYKGIVRYALDCKLKNSAQANKWN